MGCYQFSLLISQSPHEKIISCDKEFKCLIESIKDSLGSKQTPLSDEKQLIDHVLKISTLIIAEKLLKDEAVTLPIAYEIFIDKKESLLLEAKSFSPRWLLCQVSLLLKHHPAYSCIYGTTLF